MSNIYRPDLSDEINGNRAPLTIKELQARLKHIAGLCWGLSIDLTNEIESKAAIIAEFDKQEAENAELRKQLETARKELAKCKSLAARNEVLKLENARLKQAVEMARAKSRRAAIDEHTEQLAWERKEYGEILSYNQHGKSKKNCRDEARAKRKAAFDALPEKERERRLKKRIYQKRYLEKKRAERAQGGNNET